MTDIATKNGAVILKDGAAAENCTCCGEWYCYDYSFCVCDPASPPSLQPSGRRFYIIPKWTITRESYGLLIGDYNELTQYTPPNPSGTPPTAGSSTYVKRRYTYRTTFTQASFASALYASGYQTTDGSPILYTGLGVDNALGCQYSWDSGDEYGYGITWFAPTYGGGAVLSYRQLVLIGIGCTKKGIMPSVDVLFRAAAIPATVIPELSYSATGLRLEPYSSSLTDVTTVPSVALLGTSIIPGDESSALEQRLSRPPAPDLAGVSITKNPLLGARCFGEFTLTYPVKKWSLTSVTPLAAEFITVGTLELRIGDTFSLGSL